MPLSGHNSLFFKEILRKTGLLCTIKWVSLGILRPLLMKIGQYYETGKISVEKEHLFSKSVGEVLSLVKVNQSKESEGIVLFTAENNTHTLGLEFLRQPAKSVKFAKSSIRNFSDWPLAIVTDWPFRVVLV